MEVTFGLLHISLTVSAPNSTWYLTDIEKNPPKVCIIQIRIPVSFLQNFIEVNIGEKCLIAITVV